MKTFSKFVRAAAVAAVYASVAAGPAGALTYNGDYGFDSLNPAPNGSGLGNYNIILFENAAGGSGNASGAVNVDNSNKTLPTGNTSSSGTLYWYTTAGDLQAFYTQQFPNTTINNIVLFLDINETGSGSNPVTLNNLTIYKNATTTPSLNPSGDLTSDQQASITSFSGGTLLKQLSNVGESLLQQNTGQGADDWAIFTFINPFALLPSDTLLFKIALDDLSAGGETLSINGALTPCDIDPVGCPTTTTGSTTSDPTTTTGNTTSDPTTTTGSTTSDPTTTTGSTTSDPTTTTTSGNSTWGSTDGVLTTAGSTGESSGTTRDIPEPSSFLLLGAGLVALSRAARKKQD